jgi:murein DD-endopeptidase MepM/ murein hydrolase activator NlpD
MNVKLNGEEFFRVTEPFGAVNSVHTTSHTGIDLATFGGTPLPSASDGIVETVYHLGNVNIGNGIKIQNPDGSELIYGHLSQIFVKEGQHVHIGDIIGKTGNSGHVVGAGGGYHLHLGEKINGQFVDPTSYVDVLQWIAHNILEVGWSTVQCIIHIL